MNKILRQRGFTIVELLVVIVIIAILASITIVSYNGIQQRAKSATYVSSLHNWENILRLMNAESGQWYNTGGYAVCLGKNFTAADGFVANQCVRSVPTSYISISTSSAFDTEVTNSMGSIPSGVLPLVKTVDPSASNREGYARGLVYSYDPNSSTGAYIEYYLDKATGGGGCIAGDTLEYGAYADGGKRCRRYMR